MAGVTVYLDASDPIDGIVERVWATAGGGVGHKDIIPAGGTPAAGECEVTMSATTGKSVITFAGADTVSACTVQYRSTGTAYRALITDME